MDKAAITIAILSLATTIAIPLLLAHAGVPDPLQVIIDTLTTVRDQAAAAGVYDRNFDPAFNMTIIGLMLTGFISTILGLSILLFIIVKKPIN